VTKVKISEIFAILATERYVGTGTGVEEGEIIVETDERRRPRSTAAAVLPSSSS